MLISEERKKQLLEFSDKYSLGFEDVELLNNAFLHTSFVSDINENRLKSYERLEFLGDAVLKLIASDFLFKKFSDEAEGKLTEQRAIIVSDKTLAEFAKIINLNSLILTGKCEAQEKEVKDSILACAFEALLGAIYLQHGDLGYNKAKNFFLNLFEEKMLQVDFSNPKAELQEYTQKIAHKLPEYKLIEAIGPQHKRTFTVGVYFEDRLLASANGFSKKEAEVEAAKIAFLKLKEENNE